MKLMCMKHTTIPRENQGRESGGMGDFEKERLGEGGGRKKWEVSSMK